jgi:hypothetical protein
MAELQLLFKTFKLMIADMAVKIAVHVFARDGQQDFAFDYL